MSSIGVQIIVPTYTVVSGSQITYRLLRTDERGNQKEPTDQFVPVLDTSTPDNLVVVVDTADPRIVHTGLDFTFDPVFSATFINIPATNDRIRYNGYAFSSLQNYQQFHANGKNRGGPLNLYDTRPEQYVVNLNTVEYPTLMVIGTLPYQATGLLGLGQLYTVGIYPVLKEDGANLLMAIPFTGLVSDGANEILLNGSQLYMHNSTWNINIPFHHRAYFWNQISQYDDYTEQYFRTNPVPVLTATTPVNLNAAAQIQRVHVRSFAELCDDVSAAQVVQPVHQEQVPIQQQLADGIPFVPFEPSHEYELHIPDQESSNSADGQPIQSDLHRLLQRIADGQPLPTAPSQPLVSGPGCSSTNLLEKRPTASAGFIQSDLDSLFQGISDDQPLPPSPEHQLISVAGPSKAKEPEVKKPRKPRKLPPPKPVVDESPTIAMNLLNKRIIHEFDAPGISSSIRVVAGPTNYTLLPIEQRTVVLDSYVPLLDNVYPTLPVRGNIFVYNPADPNPETRGPFPAKPVFTGTQFALLAEETTAILVNYKGWAFWPMKNYVIHYETSPTANLKRPEQYVGTEQEPEVQLRQIFCPQIVPKKYVRVIQTAYSTAYLKPAMQIGHGLSRLYMVVPFCEVALRSNEYIQFRKEIYMFNKEYQVMCRCVGFAFDHSILAQTDLADNYRIRPVPESELLVDNRCVLASVLSPSKASKRRNRHLQSGVYSLKPIEVLPIGTKIKPTSNHLLYRPVLDIDGKLYLLNTVTSACEVIPAKLVQVEQGPRLLVRTYICSMDNEIWFEVLVDKSNVWVFKGLKDTFLYLINDQPSLMDVPSVYYNDSCGQDIETDDDEQHECNTLATKFKLTTMGKRNRQLNPSGPRPPTWPPAKPPAGPKSNNGLGIGPRISKSRGARPYSRVEDIEQTIESVVAQTLPSGSPTGAELSPSSLPSSALSMPTFQSITGSMLSASLLSMPTMPVNPVQPDNGNEQQAPGAQPVVPAAPGSKRKSSKDGSTSASKK